MVGIVLILSPRIFGLESGSPEAVVPVTFGWAALIYSALTRYELGLIKVVSFRTHLALDLMSGIFLAASPWLLGFAERVWVPHLMLGCVEIGAVLLTGRSADDLAHSPVGGTNAHH